MSVFLAARCLRGPDHNVHLAKDNQLNYFCYVVVPENLTQAGGLIMVMNLISISIILMVRNVDRTYHQNL